MTAKQTLLQQAKELLEQAQAASQNAQYAQGQNYWEEKAKADRLWAKYYEVRRQADECPT